MQCPYKRTYMYTTAWSREEVNSTKLVHKFRAATFECNAGQCESDALNIFINSRLIWLYATTNMSLVYLLLAQVR